MQLQVKLIVAFVIVFVAGGIAGGFIGAAHMHHRFARPPHRAFVKDRMGERLKRQLDLTPEQVQKISPIIEKASAELDAIRTETAERVHKTMTQAHQDMSVSLTDEQRQKLKQVEMRHRHRRFMRDRPPPPPEDRQQ